jgi:hypothetical protein
MRKQYYNKLKEVQFCEQQSAGSGQGAMAGSCQRRSSSWGMDNFASNISGYQGLHAVSERVSFLNWTDSRQRTISAGLFRVQVYSSFKHRTDTHTAPSEMHLTIHTSPTCTRRTSKTHVY